MFFMKATDKINEKMKDWKSDLQLGFVPSMITVFAMTLGIHAIRFLFAGKIDMAMLCIAIAGVLDALDGKVARYLQVSSKFGGTLDTLADFLNFGIVPAFALYVKYAAAANLKIYWLAVVVYIVSMALRLARFSVIGMEDGKFFKGVPAPGAAFLVALPLCFEHAWYDFSPTYKHTAN